MPIRQIVVHNHKKTYGENQSEHVRIKQRIHDIILEKCTELDMQKIDVYNLKHEYHNYRAGHKDRMVIFIDATHFQAESEEEKEFRGQKLLPTTDGGIHFEYDGNVIATYYKDTFELNIHYALFEKLDVKNFEIFSHIMIEFNERVAKSLQYANSWKHTDDKESLTRQFTERFKQQAQRVVKEDRHRLEENEQRVDRYKRELKQAYDRIIQLRRNIENEENNISKIGDKLIEQLNLIVNHSKVVDLRIKDGLFHVFTAPIYAYDHEENRYYIGNMNFTMDLTSSDVRFFGDNPRQGYWTDHDPHPHVSGSDGRPCLGNVASTIAELSSRNEVYALTLMCIDYLESVNVSDPAGAKVRYWDMVDEEGNIIQEGGEEEEFDHTCDRCDEGCHEVFAVYEYIEADEDGDLEAGGDIHEWCSDCRDEYAHYDDTVEEYIQD